MERLSLWSLPQEITQPLVCQPNEELLFLEILSFYSLLSFPPDSLDYTSTTFTLSFTSGQTIGIRISKTISIVNDNIAESIESFFGSLSLQPTGLNVSVSPDQAEIYITDNDGKD